MKIQFYGQNHFSLKGKTASCVFDPQEGMTSKADFEMHSDGREGKSAAVKKVLNLPGEFEISDVLIKGFFSDNRTNVIYKVVMDNMVMAHFGSVKEVPNGDFFENLGGNIDIAFICLSEDFDEKKAKELLGKVEPRMAFLGGDVSFFPKMVESTGAKTAEENPMTVSKSSLSDDKTEIFILNA